MAEEQFYTILTNVGKAKVANAALLSNSVTLKTLKIGDSNGSYYSPTEDQKELRNVVYSCDVGLVKIDEDNPNWIIAETIIPGSVGGFTIREIGLFDVDGDLIAVGKYPETYKPVVANGASKDLCIRTIFEVSNTESVNLSINPSVIIATKEDINNLQEQIDEHKIEYEELKDDVEQLSNPNLLINGGLYVWQKGEVFDSIANSSYVYTADRWAVSHYGTKGAYSSKVTKNAYGLNIVSVNSANTQNMILIQELEDTLIKYLRGKTVTLTVKYKDKTTNKVNIGFRINDVYGEYVSEDYTEDFGIMTYTCTLPEDITELGAFIITNGTINKGITICYAKLELGDKATPFYPKLYEEELQACRRYCKYIDGMTLGSSASNSNTQFFNISQFTYDMRIVPSLSYKQLYLSDNSAYSPTNIVRRDPSSYTVNGVLQHRIRIDKVINSANFSTNMILQIEGLLLDSEIY